MFVGHVGHLAHDLLQEFRVELVLARLAASLGVQLSWLHSRRVRDLLPLGNWLVDLLNSSLIFFLLLKRCSFAKESHFALFRADERFWLQKELV